MSDLRYQVFGLRISSERAIPGLVAASDVASIDVRVQFLSRADIRARVKTDQLWFTSPRRADASQPVVQVWSSVDGAYFRFRYADGAEFLLDRQGTQIWAAADAENDLEDAALEDGALEDAAIYLLGPILGFVLRLRGVTTLHASAVAIHSRAVVFLGAHRAGKSTLAAAFVQRGYALISEDTVALVEQGNRFLAQPGFPRVRLWEEAAQALFGSADALPRATTLWDKRHLDVRAQGYAFQTEPLPLRVIYCLGGRSADARAPWTEPLTPREKLMALVTNARENSFIDKAMRAAEFQALARVADSAPMRRVIPHAEWSRLSALCDVILRDLAARDAS